jgi:Protein of unknown function (DUF3987)
MNFTIAESTGGFNNTSITPWDVTPNSLVKALKNPAEGVKDGSYFIRCAGTYRDDAHTDTTAHILILDGDKRINADGEHIEGAPAPAEVHKTLTNLGLSHLIYSSYSNGATREEIAAKQKPDKPEPDTGGAYDADFYKYRVVIFCTYTKDQLPALLAYVLTKLHDDGVMFAHVKEQGVWSQPWYFPRVPDQSRLNLFRFYDYEGNGDSLDVAEIYSRWNEVQQAKKAAHHALSEQSRQRATQLTQSGSNPIDAYNEAYSVEQNLELYGFIRRGKKWVSPYSQSGVAQLSVTSDGKNWNSWHGSDAEKDMGKEQGNHRFGDSFDLHRRFEYNNVYSAALKAVSESFITSSGKTFQNQNQINYNAAMEAQSPPPDISALVEQAQAVATKPEPAIVVPLSTFNHTLDTEHKYCTVDLLRYVDDDHLLKQISLQLAAETHLPVNTVFLMGLAVFSSMAARKYAVLYKDGCKLPLGLYAVAEQPSGTGKSRCINTFKKPFEAIQKRIMIETLKQISLFDKRIAGDGEKLEPSECELYNELQAKAKRLGTGLFISNGTAEGVERTLPDTGGFFSCIAAEQGLFNSLLGVLYKSDSAANNNDIVLSGFDGGSVNSVRAKSKGFNGDVVGGIACFAQQGTIETLLGKSNGTGLAERFLMLVEPHSLGKRDHTQEVKRNPLLSINYEMACNFISGILENPKELESLSGLEISEAGFLEIKQYRNKIEPDIDDGRKFSHVSLRGAAGKVDMQVMKIAANLEILDSNHGADGDLSTIQDKHVISAIYIANELLEANLKLCTDKGIIGLKAEFTAILSLFENDQRPRVERNIIQSKIQKIPFKEFSGNKSALIKKTLGEMVEQHILTKLLDGNVTKYQMA